MARFWALHSVKSNIYKKRKKRQNWKKTWQTYVDIFFLNITLKLVIIFYIFNIIFSDFLKEQKTYHLKTHKWSTGQKGESTWQRASSSPSCTVWAAPWRWYINLFKHQGTKPQDHQFHFFEKILYINCSQINTTIIVTEQQSWKKKNQMNPND